MKKTLPALIVALALLGCMEPLLVDLETTDYSFGGDKSRVSPARVVQTNFYIGQDYQDDQILGATDEFYLDTDPMFTVFAQVPRDPNFERGGRLTFEMRNPDNRVIEAEHRPYNPKQVTGIIFDASKLADRGGEGLWSVSFFADSLPLGRLEFGIYKSVEDAGRAREALAREQAEETGQLRAADYIVR